MRNHKAMDTTFLRKGLSRALICFIFTVFLGSITYAADWETNGVGNWDDNANWDDPDTFPNGVDASANVAHVNITGNRTISLNQDITLGVLYTGDTSGTSRYVIAQGTAGNLIFDVSSGNAIHTSISSTYNQINADVILSDNVEISSPSDVAYRGTISGAGGFIVHNGNFTIRESTNNFTGDIILNNGSSLLLYSSNPPGAIIINEGYLRGYYIYTLSRALGTGAGQISIAGGESGFGWNNNMNVKINNNASTVVQWGSADFNPSPLLLDNTSAGSGKTLTFQNILDLNGVARTIKVGPNSGYTAIMSGEIRDTGSGASLTKTGIGDLRLSAVNTYAGNTTVNAGTLEFTQINSSNENSTITIASGASLNLNFSGMDTVKYLVINGTQYGTGRYGHTNSGANNGGLGVGALDSYYGTGTGILEVIGDPPIGTIFVYE
jgi:autotransporter-associated beta strand protein